MSNYNDMIGDTVITDAGEHVILSHVYDDNCSDGINLYVGRDSKGYYNLIASDNASMWVVGDEYDSVRNHSMWYDIGYRYDVARDAILEIDADLVYWLDSRRADALEYDEVEE